MGDETYQQGVYLKQTEENVDDKLVVAATGQILGEEDGRLETEEGFQFYLVDTEFLAQQLKFSLLGLATYTKWGMSGTNASGPSIIAPEYGYHIYSASTGMSKVSLALPEANKGAILVLDFSQCAVDANFSIFAESGGDGAVASLYGRTGDRLSSIEASAEGYVKMIAVADNVWQIVDINASVDEEGA